MDFYTSIMYQNDYYFAAIRLADMIKIHSDNSLYFCKMESLWALCATLFKDKRAETIAVQSSQMYFGIYCT